MLISRFVCFHINYGLEVPFKNASHAHTHTHNAPAAKVTGNEDITWNRIMMIRCILLDLQFRIICRFLYMKLWLENKNRRVLTCIVMRFLFFLRIIIYWLNKCSTCITWILFSPWTLEHVLKFETNLMYLNVCTVSLTFYR